MGIISGDYVFIVLAVFGLATLAEIMGDFFVVIKYIGAAYLFFLGFRLITAKESNQTDLSNKPYSKSANYLVGLLTTLGNPKAILFYVSFYPAFLDLKQVSLLDVATLILIATLSVGLVMVCYAYIAAKTKSRFKASPRTRYLKYGSGTLLVGGGVLVALRS